MEQGTMIRLNVIGRLFPFKKNRLKFMFLGI